LAPLKADLTATERLVAFARRIGLRSDPAMVVGDYEKFLSGIEERAKNQARYQAPQTNEITEESAIEEEIPSRDLEIKTPAAVSLNRIEKTLVQELVQHPELLLRKEMTELLDFVSVNEVKEFVLRLRDLLYEIDESEYEALVGNILGGDHFGLELSTTASAALYRYRPSTLNEKVVERMVADLKKRLGEDRLRHKRDDLMKQSKEAQSTEEQNRFLTELGLVDKELAALRATKVPHIS
jgi:DNA primase